MKALTQQMPPFLKHSLNNNNKKNSQLISASFRWGNFKIMSSASGSTGWNKITEDDSQTLTASPGGSLHAWGGRWQGWTGQNALTVAAAGCLARGPWRRTANPSAACPKCSPWVICSSGVTQSKTLDKTSVLLGWWEHGYKPEEKDILTRANYCGYEESTENWFQVHLQ